jgi:hypothetical protein
MNPAASTWSQPVPTVPAMSLADLERFSKASPVVASLLAEGRIDGLTAAVSIAAACGYHFTVEEAKAFVSRRPATATRHLTDAQLEKVTGGLGSGESA